MAASRSLSRSRAGLAKEPSMSIRSCRFLGRGSYAAAAATPLVPALALLLFATPLVLAGCEEDDVGIPCGKAGEAPAPDPQGGPAAPQITTNALDCRSRLCLSIGDKSDALVRPLCTALCEEDSDCPDSAEACPKGEGFRCTVTVQTTALACCKRCVCKYFLAGKDPGATATACSKITANCPKL
jgi:hypothetical protein